MANQQNSYTGSQGTGTNSADFSFTFPSFTTGEVKVEVDNVVKTLTTHYTVENYNTTSGGTVRFTTNNIPTGTTPVRIFRQTDVDSPKATFTAGSSLKAGEINDNFKQVRHALQEAIGAVATDRKVQRFNIEADTIDGTLIADDVINSEHYVAGSIDHEHLANDIIDGDNIQDDVINSEHYVAGSIDEEHLANSAITQNKIANNSVGTPELINGSVNSDKILDGTIVNVDVNASAAIAGTKIAPNFGSQNVQTTGDISGNNLGATGNITVGGTVDGRDVAADGTKLDGIDTGAKDDQTAAEIKTLLQSNKLTASEIANDAVTADKIADAVIVTNSEQASASVNDTTFFTTSASDARYFNISSGDTIKDGQSFPDNDTTIATTAAINDRIIDLVDDVGGFVPIASETAFPSANPDVNNGAGTLVSVKAIGSTRTPSGGTVTIANGSGSNTVTITGCGSTVLTAGFGVIVETTTTLHTYAFHRLVPKATEVTTVAGISSNVTTVATNIADINTVAADLNEGTSEIDTVATNIANVNNVGNSIANVNTTAGSIANVNTTAGSITNVNNVGNNISNVNSVAGNASNINSAVSNASNINSAVSNASNINTVAGSISNVNTTAGSISNVNTVASNINNVNSFFNTYRIGANNPISSLDVGDLFFNTTANSLKVYTGSAWVDGVTATGNFAVVTGNTFTGTNNHNDNVKSIYGTGSDLHIFHDSTSSFNNIQGQTGSNTRVRQIGNGGALYLAATNIHLQNHNNNETYLYAVNNGAVSLRYDNSVKLATESTGVAITGALSFGDGSGAGGTNKISFGASDDLNIYHNGSHSFVQDTGTGSLKLAGADVQVVNADNTAVMAQFISGGKNELRFDGSTKLETTSGGASVTGELDVSGHVDVNSDTARLKLGAGDDLQLYHDGTNSYILNNGGQLRIQPKTGEYAIICDPDGAVELYYNNSLRLATTANGVTLGHNLLLDNATNAGRDVTWDPANDQLKWNDNTKASLGNSADLQIYHDGTSSFISNTGELFIRSNGSALFLQAASNENAIKVIPNAAVELYYDNSKKLETTSGGVEIPNALFVGEKIDLPDHTTGSTGMILLGTGDDLYMYHDGTNSHFRNNTGTFNIRSTNFRLTDAAIQHVYLKTNDSGNNDIQLYYDNNVKLQTSSTGVTVTGTVAATSYTGDGSNLSGINTDLVGDTSPQLGGTLDVNSQVVSFDDATGVDVNRCKFGTGNDLHIYHNASDSMVRHEGTGHLVLQSTTGNIRMHYGNENMLVAIPNGAVELYWDNAKKFETYQYGIRTTQNIDIGTHAYWGDNGEANFGASQDLTIHHDGSNSYITNSTGILHLRGQGSGIRLQKSDGEPMIYAIPDGAVKLYYDQTEKAETASHGMYYNEAYLHHHVNSGNTSEIRFTTANVRRGSVYADNGNTVGFLNPSGGWSARWSASTHTSHVNIHPNADNTYDLGSTSKRWRNLFTGDLHMSNKGSSNDVDGSWGDWTFQEGESDLFLKNNRSGKQYKLNLTEVS